jgi:hypothetical protein
MTTFIQGKKYTLKANFNGAIYSVPTWASLPAGQVNLTPSVDGLSCDFSPVVDATVEQFTISCTTRNDPDDATKLLTLQFTGQDAFIGATGGTLDLQ